MEQNLIELKWEIDKHMIIVGEVDRKAVKIWKTQIMLSINLTYVALIKYVTQPEQNTHSFQVYNEHFSKWTIWSKSILHTFISKNVCFCFRVQCKAEKHHHNFFEKINKTDKLLGRQKFLKSVIKLQKDMEKP